MKNLRFGTILNGMCPGDNTLKFLIQACRELLNQDQKMKEITRNFMWLKQQLSDSFCFLPVSSTPNDSEEINGFGA